MYPTEKNSVDLAQSVAQSINENVVPVKYQFFTFLPQLGLIITVQSVAQSITEHTTLVKYIFQQTLKISILSTQDLNNL